MVIKNLVHLESRNIIRVMLVSWLIYAIIKILQVVFRIWLYIGREIVFCLVPLWFNQESTYSVFQHLPVFKVSVQLPLTRIINIRKLRNQKSGKYDPTLNMQTCGHISFEMLGSNFRPDCRDLRYLRYMYLKVKLFL